MIVCEKKAWKEFLTKAHPFYKAYLKDMRLTEGKFMGTDVLYTTLTISSEDGTNIDDYKGKIPKGVENFGDSDEPMYDGRQIMEAIVEELKKFTPNIICESEYC